MKFKQIWEFIRRFSKRITGIYTPFGGISWKEDDLSQSASETSEKTVARQTSQETTEENSIPSEIPDKKSIKVRCEFCRGSTKDPFILQPCRVCKGLGNVILDFNNPIRCKYCRESGRDPNKLARCPICGGLAWVEES